MTVNFGPRYWKYLGKCHRLLYFLQQVWFEHQKHSVGVNNDWLMEFICSKQLWALLRIIICSWPWVLTLTKYEFPWRKLAPFVIDIEASHYIIRSSLPQTDVWDFQAARQLENTAQCNGGALRRTLPALLWLQIWQTANMNKFVILFLQNWLRPCLKW